MARFRFKACPKCHGDLYLDHSVAEGWCEQCIQCGYRKYLDIVANTGQFTGREEMIRYLIDNNVQMQDATDTHWPRSPMNGTGGKVKSRVEP